MVNATSAAAGIIGVIVLARHGDRTLYYQEPLTYRSQQAYLTSLGANQEYQLGSFLRDAYLDSNSSSHIEGINPENADMQQLRVRAEGGGGNAGVTSAYSLLQGLYPPTETAAIKLHNGSTVEAPLHGYQYIPVETIMQDGNPMLTPWIDCPYFQSHLNRTFNSSVWKDMEREAAPFLNASKPFIGSMDTNFTNMYNIYDYMNVQSTHDEGYRKALPPTFLEQARHFANMQQREVFNAQPINAIGEVAVRTLIPEMIWAMGNMTSNESPLKLALTTIDYQPFISFFNVTNATVKDPDVAGIPNYASALALEVFEGKDGEPELSLKFKNGTDDNEFRSLTMWGNDRVSLETFTTNLAYRTINNTRDWCFSCNETFSRGCFAMDFSKDPFLNPAAATY
ncbi:phosphoglycerate mutase-like protein [Coniophora puteana RWD-64-598 SS2]|uniref:Phosphoglycerate mutase-like protein n=1 Tax=Coniophora puteana (strain RWD-64-598) TaxID=741705 RepID=A0A5M3MU98_CONPW|nr:phosphoglycerate mutase-like protein [Coniophora puteana RWD-64-598 SS2]EIW82161.1 phosphoglycerate mutase-like protein [Coniophora puteana RWD-64-598 SS2]